MRKRCAPPRNCATCIPRARFVVVDTEAPGVVRLELARKLADALNALYFKTEDLRAEDLVALAKETQTW